MRFPYQLDEQPLETADLKRLEFLFSRTVTALLPCAAVSFLAKEPQAAAPVGPGRGELPQSWEVGGIMVERQGKPVVDGARRRIYLPIWNDDEVMGVAIAEGVDPLLLESRESWLLDRSHLLSREMRILKRWAVDPLTGLLNGQAFHDELVVLLADRGREGGDAMTVVLIEAELPLRSGRQAVTRIAGYLDSMLGGEAPLHHFGAGLFAMIWNGLDRQAAAKMAATVQRWLDRERLGTCRIGMNSVELRSLAATGAEERAKEILDGCWLALEEARRKRSAAAVNHAGDTGGELRLLEPPPAAIMRKLAGLWKGSGSFALVLLQVRERPGEGLMKRLLTLLGETPSVADDGSVWVLLDRADGDEARRWLAELRQRLRRLAAEGAGFAAGIAVYPLAGYAKRQTAENAGKALRHALFYGEDGEAEFNDVSLNISGDILYENGNLGGAVDEFLAGLKLNPDSANLLNSLGVCYAQQGRYREAIPCFRRALAIDASDFMAWYNLGLACRQTGEADAALAALEKAKELGADGDDALLLLGEMYIEAKRFAEARAILAAVLSARSMGRGGSGLAVRSRAADGRLYRLLGLAHVGLADIRQGMAMLEKAVASNHADTVAIGLLAELYAQAGEGDELALSLARKAVDLDDGDWRNWFRLARLLEGLGKPEEAREALAACRRLGGRNREVERLRRRVTSGQPPRQRGKKE